MYANGFFEQNRRSPASLALVIALHAGAFAALALYGTTQFARQETDRTAIFDVPIVEPPPPLPPPPDRQEAGTPQRESVIEPARRVTDNVLNDNVVDNRVADPPRLGDTIGRETVEPRGDPPPPPVRRAAEVDPRYAGELQPPYPRSEESAQRGGIVRVRITIGANGRVTGIERLEATSEAFWRATERHARGRWRFRPATLDGRPVESTMVMNVRFRIPEG